jgi:DNA-binding transcriptional MocR family regulator
MRLVRNVRIFMSKIPRYRQLADQLAAAVEEGLISPGERLASVRQAGRQHGLSVSTVLRAYALLESRGILESHPQSGYFVRAALVANATAPAAAQSAHKPAHAYQYQAAAAEVDVGRLVLATMRTIQQQGVMPLGSPYPSPAWFPSRRLGQIASRITRQNDNSSVFDDLPPGHPELLRQIARRYTEGGMRVSPEDIIVTVGATEAINLCLQAVAKPGDTIAVESPTFYAMLHAIERLGMRAIEIPTDPLQGIDIEALTDIIAAQPVAAMMIMPTFQNPMGFLMPDARKRQLVALANQHQIPIIEDAVYNELYYGACQPKSLKTFDTEGLVLHCASFSKSLSSAYRIGWALPGRYRDRVEKLKFLNTLATPTIPQRAIAEFLAQGGYERHLRRLRRILTQQRDLMRAAVKRWFPRDTQISMPQGGYVLWITLAPEIDAMQLYANALAQGITLAPGRIFSVSDRYRHCIRLNYSYAWSLEIENALKALGSLVAEMTMAAAAQAT